MKKPTPARKNNQTPKPEPARAAFLRRLQTKTWVRFCVIWLAAYLVLLGFFCKTLLEGFGYTEIFPQELIIPLLMHAITALIIAAVLFWLPWLRTFLAKLAAATFLALFMVDYDANFLAASGLIRAFTPGLTTSDPLPLVSLVYLVLLVLLSVLIGVGLDRLVRHFKRIKPRDAQLGLLVLIIFLFIVPALSVTRLLPAMIKQSRVQAPEFTSKTTDQLPAEKPDIYYIVLDRYTNAQVLEQQFQHDNHEFTEFLKQHGFAVKNNAYANYPYTAISVSSTLNAQYTKDLVAPFKNDRIQSRTLYNNLIWQSSVVKALKQQGYRYHVVGAWYGTTYEAPLADVNHVFQHKVNLFGATKRLNGIEGVEFTKSPYIRLSQTTAAWSPVKYTFNDHVSIVREQLKTLDQLSANEEPGGRFIFAHILVPHEPYSFNADGSLSTVPETDSLGKPIKEKYVAQVEFINSQVKELVANIRAQSRGEAVIILSADEGPYPQYHNSTFKQPLPAKQAITDTIFRQEDMRDWSDDWLKMKFGILQAVHMPRATEADLAALSSVNIFRIVLNRYAGHDLEYLPDCHFGVINGSQNEFNYADLTAKITGKPDSACQQFESLPDI